jgi:hypothetical protein
MRNILSAAPSVIHFRMILSCLLLSMPSVVRFHLHLCSTMVPWIPMIKFSCFTWYPGSFESRGLLSLVFRTENVWLRCNQCIETSEFLIFVDLGHLDYFHSLRRVTASRSFDDVYSCDRMCSHHHLQLSAPPAPPQFRRDDPVQRSASPSSQVVVLSHASSHCCTAAFPHHSSLLPFDVPAPSCTLLPPACLSLDPCPVSPAMPSNQL